MATVESIRQCLTSERVKENKVRDRRMGWQDMRAERSHRAPCAGHVAVHAAVPRRLFGVAHHGHPAAPPVQAGVLQLEAALDSDEWLALLDKHTALTWPGDKIKGAAGHMSGVRCLARAGGSSKPASHTYRPQGSTPACALSPPPPTRGPPSPPVPCMGTVSTWPGMLDVLLGCISRLLAAHRRPLKLFDSAYGRWGGVQRWRSFPNQGSGGHQGSAAEPRAPCRQPANQSPTAGRLQGAAQAGPES